MGKNRWEAWAQAVTFMYPMEGDMQSTHKARLNEHGTLFPTWTGEYFPDVFS